MSINYHISSENGLISLLADPEVTLAELHDCGKRLMADQAFEPDLPQLIDLRAANIERLCTTDQQLAQTMVETYNGSVPGNVAVLIDAASAGEPLADLYRTICTFENAELFDNYEHALRWLVRKAFAPAAADSSVAPTSAAPDMPQGALRPLGQQPDPAAEQTNQRPE